MMAASDKDQSQQRAWRRRFVWGLLIGVPLVLLLVLARVASWRPQTLAEEASSAIAFAPDGSRFAAGGLVNSIRLWNADFRPERPLDVPRVETLAFAPDGQSVATGVSRRVDYSNVWSVDVRGVDGNLRRAFAVGPLLYGSITCLAFSPDGGAIACGISSTFTGSDSRHQIRVWDEQSGVLRWQLDEPGYAVYALSFSPDSSVLAAGTSQGVTSESQVRLFDARIGKLRRTVGGSRPLMPFNARHGRLPQRALPSGRSAAFLPTGRLLTAGDGGVAVWGASGTTLLSTFGERCELMSCSRDGRFVALSGGSRQNDTRASVWDVQTGQRLRQLQSNGVVNALALAPDGSSLVVGSKEPNARGQTLRLWRLR